ncbi:MAG: RagB/SusD family nutrient uptake outer membrane protein [Pseudobacter sp.]|uniref:RagB/SusD family nutrient uptake outer membrane protein n=1 Tax=Pseudobacter sp. TaxID=2045420 RepID=UPI003F7E3838
MRKTTKYTPALLLFTILTGTLVSCTKLVEVDEPINSITAEKMFRTEAQAEGALAGVYNSLIHGPRTAAGSSPANAILNGFAGGLSTLAGGLSAGELIMSSGNRDAYALATNTLTLTNNSMTNTIWTSAYNAIYHANAVIEGIAGAQNSTMRDSVKVQYTAEAKFLRAFSYFHLVNFFGEVPVTLTVDFSKTVNIPRSPVPVVYAQILRDLLDAERDLPATYAAGKNLRVRVNKWGAKAMLAKVYLYMGDNGQAAAKASEVIAESGLFQLMPLNDIFLSGSREAILQFKQTNQDATLRNAVSEGHYFIPVGDPYKAPAGVWVSDQLLAAFEEGDQRKEVWLDSTLQTTNGLNVKVWYPVKYKHSRNMSVLNAPSPELYMVLRLADMYLIRAEARANGADGGYTKAIDDLNAVRSRTSLQNLSAALNETEVKEAVIHEREIEMFAEWGNRWMDLRRTGRASAVLSAMPLKQPWEGDYQLLYPVPAAEIEANRNLGQNNGYIR